MSWQDVYCRKETCLPDYAKTLEGLAILKLLKLLVVFKNEVNGEKNYFAIKNELNHVSKFTQKNYKFTAFVQLKGYVTLYNDGFFRQQIIDVNLSELVDYIEQNDVLKLIFANRSWITIFDHCPRYKIDVASEQCDRHEIVYSKEQLQEIFSLASDI